MLLMTTNKRVSAMMKNTKNVKDSKRYLKEVMKSGRNLYKDVRDEVTVGKFNSNRATIMALKEEAKLQKRGFYRHAAKKAFDDNRLVQLTREFKTSVSRALKTGKLYRRESDMFSDAMSKQSNMINFQGSDSIKQDWEVNKNQATYDAAKATISSMNEGTSAQLQAGRIQTAETKMGFNRMTTAMQVGNQQMITSINSISDYMKNVFKVQMDEGLKLDRERNALLTEMRDIQKKMLINDSTYAAMNVEKDKTVTDLLMEGRFKDALIKGGENVIKEFDKKGIVQILSNSLPLALQMMLANPFGFAKDMIMSNEKISKLKRGTDPRAMVEGQFAKLMGSDNPYASGVGRALFGPTKSLDKMKITTDYNKDVMNWSGIERKALVDVIPTYLRKILSALTNTDELIYNYKTGEYTNTKELKQKITNHQERRISGTSDLGDTLNKHFRSTTQGANSTYSFSATFDAYTHDIAISGLPVDFKQLLQWKYYKFKQFAPETKISQKAYDFMRTQALSLLYGTTDKALRETFEKQIAQVQNNIKSYRKEHEEFLVEIGRDSDLTGFASLVNKSGTIYGKQKKNKNNGGGNGGGPNPPQGPTADEMLEELFTTKRKQVDATDTDNEINRIYGNDASKSDIFFDRLSNVNAEDFKAAGFKLNVHDFKKWLDAKHGELSDETKEMLKNAFAHNRWDKIKAKIGSASFGQYIDEIRSEHFFDLSKATFGERKKIRALRELRERQGQVNSAFDGLEASFADIGNDPAKREAMTGLIAKMATAGGIAGITGMTGLIPFAGAMGPAGIMAMAAGGIGLSMLSNRKELKSLIFGGMDQDQQDNTKKISSFLFSKGITGLGVGGAVGLLAPIVGAGPVLAPLVAATAGIAVAMNSEKSGFKKFFFGDAADQSKTFFQLFKAKMLGDGTTADEGMFGRFLNPIIGKTGSLFDKFNENLKKNVFDPLSKSFKGMVEKIDASSLGQKFKDAMGFSLTEFNGIMKKNVWAPLTKGILGGIKKLFGWGRKAKDKLQDAETAPLTLSSDTQKVYDDEVAANPAAAAGASRGGRASRSYRSYGLGGAVFGSPSKESIQDFLEAAPAAIGAKANLIGSSMSIPNKHYYSQFDPEYKDIKMGFLGTSTTIEKEGCGIMAAAMILSRFGKVEYEEDKSKKTTVTPAYISKVLVPASSKFYDLGGLNFKFFQAISNRYNMEYTLRKTNELFTIDEIKKITAGGKGVIVALAQQKQGFGNHYIVITGVNGDRVYYDDPARKRNLYMTYDEFTSGVNVAMAMSKTKGFFGFLGKIFKGIINKLSGESYKNKKARDWKVRRELINRMTRKEWEKYRNKAGLPQEMINELQQRVPMMSNLDGSAIKDDKGKVIDDAQLASATLKNRLTTLIGSGGKGRKDRKKSEKPKDAVEKMPNKNLFAAMKGGAIPNHLTSTITFTSDNAWKSLMLSAIVHDTHITNTMLGAIYTKLTEMDVTMYNGTNGVAYNVEHMKRMVAIKHFGGTKEANAAVGPIDETRLANSRFFGRRKGAISNFFGAVKESAMKKIIDPTLIGALMIKSSITDFFGKYGKFLNPFWYGEQLNNLGKSLGNFIIDGMRNITDVATAAVKGLGKFLGGALSGLGETIGGALKGFGSAIGGMVSGIGSAIGGVASALADTVREIPRMMTDTLSGITTVMTKAATGMISIAGAMTGGLYKGAKTLVTDIWKGTKGIVKSGGRGLGMVANFFKGVSNDTYGSDNEVQYVRVLGGHLDTVGTVGSIDRDAYVSEVRNLGKSTGKIFAAGKKSDNYRLGGNSTKKNKLNNGIDAEQDKASGVQDKQTELLEQIADKNANASQDGNGRDTALNEEKDAKLKWTDFIVPGLLMIPALLKKLWNDINDRTPDGRSTSALPTSKEEIIPYVAGPDHALDVVDAGRGGYSLARNGANIVKNIWNSFRKGQFIDDIGAVPGKIKAWGRNLPGIKEGLAEADAIRTSSAAGKTEAALRKNWKLGTESVEELKIGNRFKGKLADGKNAIIKQTDTGYQKITMGRNAAGKVIKNVETIQDANKIAMQKQAQREAAAGARRAVVTGARSKWIKKMDKIDDLIVTKADDLAKTIKAAMMNLLGDTRAKKIYDVLDEGLYNIFAKNMGKFIDKLFGNAKARETMVKYFSKAKNMLGPKLARMVPVLDVVFLVNDIYTGYRDADRYFDVPSEHVTKRMRIVGSVSKFLQGLVSMGLSKAALSLAAVGAAATVGSGGSLAPIGMALTALAIGIACLPTEWLTSTLWFIFGGKEKEALEVKKDEYKKKYDEYARKEEAGGKKPAKYKDWIESQSAPKKSLWRKTTDGVKNIVKKLVPTKKAGQAVALGTAATYAAAYNAGKGVGFTNIGSAYAAGNKDYLGNASVNNAALGLGAGEIASFNEDGAMLGSDGKTALERANSSSDYMNPIDPTNGKYVITSRAYKARWLKGKLRAHKGLDLRGDPSKAVYAIADGVVVYSGWQNSAIRTGPLSGFGLYVAIKHNGDGKISKYAHLSKIAPGIELNKPVKAGTVIGWVGNTGASGGNHLHFEIRDGMGRSAGVVNPEKLFIGRPGWEFKEGEYKAKDAVFGPGMGATGSNVGIPGIDGLQSTMYNQNYDLDMSRNGDGMTLAQVGCGPVTANLFLQDSGVREPLMKTAKNLKNRRTSGDGFSPSVLSDYINSRGGSSKLGTYDKAALIKSGFAIIFASRNTAINSLDENHALYMKHANENGAVLFDPYLNRSKYFNWMAIQNSVFEVITRKDSALSADAKTNINKFDTTILSDSTSLYNTQETNALENLYNKVSTLNKERKTVKGPGVQKEIVIEKTVKGPSSIDNINLASKLDAMIALLAQIVTNTSAQNANASADKANMANSVNTIINKMMKSISTPDESGPSSNDAWTNSRMRFAKGGL